MSTPATIGRILLLALPSLLMCLLFLEILFRTLVPACEMPFALFDPDENLLRFDTRGPRTGLYTAGTLSQLRAHWHINNYGWNSSIDYSPRASRSRPLIAIIGDSFIEGFQTDVDKNIAAVLRRSFEAEADVYAFGMSGAPLSEYLHLCRYVRKTFAPDIIVILVIHNDFDESLADVGNKSHQHQLTFEFKEGQLREHPPAAYVPSRVRRVVARSALFRYLVLNASVPQRIEMLRNRFLSRQGDFNANIDVNSVTPLRETIRALTTYLVEKIRDESAGCVVFMMDAPRRDIYRGTLGSSNVIWMNRLLGDACGEAGVAFLDLTEVFGRDYGQYHVKFNSDIDSHWNSRGHEVAGDALASFLRASGAFGRCAGHKVQ